MTSTSGPVHTNSTDAAERPPSAIFDRQQGPATVSEPILRACSYQQSRNDAAAVL